MKRETKRFPVFLLRTECTYKICLAAVFGTVGTAVRTLGIFTSAVAIVGCFGSIVCVIGVAGFVFVV